MQVVQTKSELDEQLALWRRAGDRIALVPTMGNLHAGHITLVETAREHAERVVVTVFVNPTQFGAGEDFEEYPRTITQDTRRLRKTGADLLFAPDVETVYPFGTKNATRVAVPGLTADLCGAFRPGHFDGVTTVVARLFSLVRPDIAVFGQKDYQQQVVIRHMVADLNLPITIVTAPTVREDSGLAMSSRNAYLTEVERETAAIMYRELRAAEDALRNGSRNFDELAERARAALEGAGFQVEYVAIRRALDLAEPDHDCDELVVLAAARLGRTRLIDNVVVTV